MSRRPQLHRLPSICLLLAACAPATPRPGAGRTPERGDLGNIYMVLIDRFANGSRANDGEVDVADATAWHGGDFAGLEQQLDYLAGLEVQTLWLSPVFEARDAPFMGHGAFHGYWVEDLWRAEARFGSTGELAGLIRAAHRRGMRVLLDFVVNHVSFDAPLVRDKPAWFHPARPIEDWNDPGQLTLRQVHGLPDLAQENEEVFLHLLGAARHWLDTTGADGFRLDAVKHVPMRFWRRFSDELRRERPDVLLLGEMYDGSSARLAEAHAQGGFTHLFDFPLAFALRDVFCEGRSAGRIGAVLTADRLAPEALVTFLDNHDLPRLASACGEVRARVQAALKGLVAMRGVPSLTYGTEVPLAGAGEPQNRGDMRFDGALRDEVASLLALRREHPVLATGATRLLGWDGALLTLLRVGADESAFVALNGGAAPATVEIPAAFGGGTSSVEGPGVLLRLSRSSAQQIADLLTGHGVARSVRIDVNGVTLGAGEQLAVVGSSPALGDWSPEAAPALVGTTALLELPVGSLFAYKLVVRRADGAVRWESGDDRYLFVAPGEALLVLPLEFRT